MQNSVNKKMTALARIKRIAVLSMVSGCALAQTPAATPQQTAPAVPDASAQATPEDLKLLWEEATNAFDGLAYTYSAISFPTEAGAKACRAKALMFKCFVPTFARPTFKVTRRYSEMPLAFKEQIAALEPGEVSEPLRSPDGSAWWVFQFHKSERANPVGGAEAAKWLSQFAAVSLPTPQQLKTDPALVARRVANRIQDPRQLAHALESGQLQVEHLDRLLSKGTTLLQRAVFKNDPDLMKALLAAGASADRCGAGSCPLGDAITLKRRDLVRLLLQNKANPTLAAQGLPPLMIAAAAADRETTQMLIDAGADLLVSRMPRYGVGPPMEESVLFYASATESPEYADWLHQQVDGVLARSGKYKWSAWIEQDGVRQPIRDASVLTLKRKPFNVVMRMGEGISFRVLASEDLALLETSKDLKLRRMYLSGMRIGASGPDSKFLSLSRLEVDADGEGMAGFTSNEWAYAEEPESRNGTVKVAVKGGVEYAHTVEEFLGAGASTPVATYPGAELAMVMGVIPPIGRGADYFAPARFRLRFK
jgi:hypothetical protein